jgi:hypothetical protein
MTVPDRSILISTYHLDGSHGPQAILRQDAQARLWLDDQPILAISPWGRHVGLTLLHRLVLIDHAAYAQLTSYAARNDSDPERVQTAHGRE